MKEVLQLFSQAIALLKEVSGKVQSQKDSNWEETLRELSDRATVIDNVPYLRQGEYDVKIDESEDFAPVTADEVSSLEPELEPAQGDDDFPAVTESEAQEAVCLPCDAEETEDFAPITEEEQCVCDDPIEVDNSFQVSQFQEPTYAQETGDFPDSECVKRAQDWAKKLTDLALEYADLKTWEGDNYKTVEYWKLFWLYYDNRESVLPEFRDLDFKTLREVIKSIKIDKRSLDRAFKRFSNELSLSLTDREVYLHWKSKNKTSGYLFDWATEFSDSLSKIPDDDPGRAQKITALEREVKDRYINAPKEDLVRDLKLWTKKHLCELLLKNSLNTITQRWKSERADLSSKEEWVNIKSKMDRMRDLESLIPKTQEEMRADLLNSGCSAPDVETPLPDEDPDYRGNPKIESPDGLSIKWWKKFSSLASLVNLVPVHWPVGLLIPNPSGLLKIPMPIVWVPLVIIPIPEGVVVFFIGQCGMCPSPVLFVWNTHPSKSLGPVNADSMSFPVAIRPSSNWKKGGGSKVIDAIPWVSNLFSKFDPHPERTQKFPYVKDDMPSWERLSIKNPLLLLHLWDWASNGKKSCGFFENP